MTGKEAKAEVVAELDPEERCVLERRGEYKLSHNGDWRPGRFFVTGKRFAFATDERFLLSIPHEKITDMRVRRRPWAMRRREILSLACREDGEERQLEARFVVKDVWCLAKWLSHMAVRPVHAELVNAIISDVGENAAALIRYLVRHGHATSREAAKTIGVQAGPEAACEIEGRVNSVARRVMERDLLRFREWWFDPETGKTVRNSYWLTGRVDATCTGKRERE